MSMTDFRAVTPTNREPTDEPATLSWGRRGNPNGIDTLSGLGAAERTAEESATPMHIALVGTRGVPAHYGGFETAVEEVGARLAAMGHWVTVYCRGDDRSRGYLGMKRVRLPALKHPVMETLSHTALSVGHLMTHRADVALVFNAANAPLVPVLRAAGMPVAVHVDGLEWKRAKWGPNGRRFYLANERLAVLSANKLIADAVGIQDYYREKYHAETELLTYGAPIINPDLGQLDELDLEPGKYHLVVARLEPENHVDVILEGYLRSDAELPLIVVGSVPYASTHEQHLHELAARNDQIRMVGGVWTQDLLDALYAGAASYLHGHHVGGTNPSLLRAMGAGAAVIAYDVNFNREVLGETGRFFTGPTDLAPIFGQIEAAPQEHRSRGRAARARAADLYRWDDVAQGYENLCRSLIGVPPRAGAVKTLSVLRHDG
jgi:glycosyltransferase involved in cell wall biosynthesis